MWKSTTIRHAMARRPSMSSRRAEYSALTGTEPLRAAGAVCVAHMLRSDFLRKSPCLLETGITGQ